MKNQNKKHIIMKENIPSKKIDAKLKIAGDVVKEIRQSRGKEGIIILISIAVFGFMLYYFEYNGVLLSQGDVVSDIDIISGIIPNVAEFVFASSFALLINSIFQNGIFLEVTQCRTESFFYLPFIFAEAIWGIIYSQFYVFVLRPVDSILRIILFLLMLIINWIFCL